MFRPIPAIITFSSERLLVFIRFVRLCNDGNRINLINTNTLSDEKLMIPGIGKKHVVVIIL